jgi:hypothetical protein
METKGKTISRNNLMEKILYFALAFAFLSPLVATGTCTAPEREKQIYFEGSAELEELISIDPTTNPPTEYDDVSSRVAERNIRKWFEHFQNKGANVAAVRVFDIDGRMLFPSAALKKAGFRLVQGRDFFPVILEESKKRGLILNIWLEEIAHIIGGFRESGGSIKKKSLTPEVVQQLIGELAAYGRKHGVEIWVNEEAFDHTYIKAIHEACRKHKVTYMHAFDEPSGCGNVLVSEDYATHPTSPDDEKEDRRYLWDTIRWGSSWGRIGVCNVLFGQGMADGKRCGVITAGGWGLRPGCQINVCIYRALQFAPVYYGFVPAGYDEPPYINKQDQAFLRRFHYKRDLLPLILEFERKPSDAKKPVANLIIQRNPGRSGKMETEVYDAAYPSTIGTITNAITAAGYDLRVTFGKPHKGNADLYYLFVVGKSDDLGLHKEIPGNLRALMDSGKPVFLQCMLALPAKGAWKHVRKKLGLVGGDEEIDSIQAGPFGPIPKYAEFRFPEGTAHVRYRGFNFDVEEEGQAGRDPLYQTLSYLKCADIEKSKSAKILVRGRISMGKRRSGDVALVTRKGSNYFVNGGFLHLAFSSVLANLMAKKPVFGKPGFVYLTSGSTRSAVFAAADAKLDVRLLGGSTVTEFDSRGKRLSETDLKLDKGRLTGRLKKWHLAVVK